MTMEAVYPPSGATILALRDEARARWEHLTPPSLPEVSERRLASAFDEIRDAAVVLSGSTRDAQLRAALYYSIYEDSEGNFMFPLVADHGSMWGVAHIEAIDRALSPLRVVSRHGRVQRWLDGMDAVRDVNRRVFREIYTTFHFTRYFGEHPGAGQFVKPAVLARYNQVHRAISQKTPLSRDQRREVYYEIFVHEQHDIVDPGLKDASAFAGRAVTEAFKRVSPRFAYFPRRERLWFSDFTSVNQRNREGLRALAFAEEVGPERVLEALGEY